MVYCFVVEQTLYYYWDYKGGRSAGTNSGEQGLYDLWWGDCFSISFHKTGGGLDISKLKKRWFFILLLHSPFTIFE